MIAKGYRVIANPGTSFSRTANPSATATGTVDSSGGYVNVRAGVTYKATTHVVEISLSGGIGQSHEKRYLIGQKLTGTLSTGPFPQVEGSHSWTGPPWYKVFQNYANGSVFLGYNSLSQPVIYFNWIWNGGYVLTCEADVSTPGGVLHVRAERDVAVDLPYYYYANVTGESVYRKAGVVVGPGDDPDDVKAGHDSDINPGMVFKASVGTPASHSVIDGPGSFQFVQLVNLDKRGWYPFSPLAVTVSTGSEWKLDNVEPYAGPFPAYAVEGNPPDSDDPNPNFIETIHDSPEFGDISVWVKVSISFEARMYLMYLPPGIDSQWIPLHRHSWRWDVDISRIPGGTWSPTTPGSVTTMESTRWLEHPTWLNTHTNTTGP